MRNYVSHFFTDSRLKDNGRFGHVLILISLFPIIMTSLIEMKFIVSLIAAIILAAALLFFRISMLQIIAILIALGMVVGDSLRPIVSVLLFLVIMLLLYRFYINSMIGDWDNSSIKEYRYVLLSMLSLSAVGTLSMFANSSYTLDSFIAVLRLYSFAILFYISYKLTASLEEIRKFYITLIIICLGISIYGYWYISQQGLAAFFIEGIILLRGANVGLGSSAFIAGLLSYGVVFSLAYYMYAEKGKLRTLSLWVFAFITLNWILWNSRANYINFIVSLIFLIAYHPRRKALIAGLAGVILVAVLLFLYTPILQEVLRLEGGLSHREEIWNAGIRMLGDNIIFGNGPGSFGGEKFYYMEPSIARDIWGTEKITAHNVLLHNAVDYGIFASLFIVCYWILVTKYFYQNIRLFKNTKIFYLYLGIGAMFVGTIFRLFFDGSGFAMPIILAAAIFKMPALVSGRTS